MPSFFVIVQTCASDRPALAFVHVGIRQTFVLDIPFPFPSSEIILRSFGKEGSGNLLRPNDWQSGEDFAYQAFPFPSLYNGVT
jgi:hypothetical protein